MCYCGACCLGDLGDAKRFLYLCVMFIRRKHNRSGTISVVVVDKSDGRFKEIHNLGVAHSDAEASVLEAEGRHWIATYGGQQLIDFDCHQGLMCPCKHLYLNALPLASIKKPRDWHV